jgi:hypothetical protein
MIKLSPEQEKELKNAESVDDLQDDFLKELLSSDEITVDPEYLLAGIPKISGNRSCVFTVENTKPKQKDKSRFTFKIKKARKTAKYDNENKFWVEVLTGCNNESDYSPLGQIDNMTFKATRLSNRDSQSFKVFNWFFNKLASNELPSQIVIWNPKHCLKCHKKLTVPQSIFNHYGPSCYSKVFG